MDPTACLFLPSSLLSLYFYPSIAVVTTSGLPFYLYMYPIAVFLNRRAAARYQTVASITPDRERLSWNLSFYFSKQFFMNKYFIVEIF